MDFATLLLKEAGQTVKGLLTQFNPALPRAIGPVKLFVRIITRDLPISTSGRENPGANAKALKVMTGASQPSCGETARKNTRSNPSRTGALPIPA